MPAAEPVAAESDQAGLYVGLISGTSMDGIDAALVRLGAKGIAVVASHNFPYDTGLRDRLQRAIDQPGTTGVDAVGDLDAVLGEAFADAARAVLRIADVKPGDVRAIGSHGQTVRHRPDRQPPFTLQLGDPNIIAARTGITTVADFRRRDLALGGEGAPLAPAFHGAMFAAAGETRVVVNIGGIANITVLSADGSISGFDTGPGNGLMDAWMQQHRREAFDRDGAWAASGRPDAQLLADFAADDYLIRQPPKSTGREYFNLPWVAAHLLALKEPPAPHDVQATLSELTALSIADAVIHYAPGARLCLVCGGGAHNADLMGRLARRLGELPVASTGSMGPEPDWVEAAGFAWLASRTLAGLPGNVPAVTGAREAAVLGAIYPV